MTFERNLQMKQVRRDIQLGLAAMLGRKTDHLCDIGDLGTEIGSILAKYPKEDVEQFVRGLQEGVSIDEGVAA